MVHRKSYYCRVIDWVRRYTQDERRPTSLQVEEADLVALGRWRTGGGRVGWQGRLGGRIMGRGCVVLLGRGRKEGERIIVAVCLRGVGRKGFRSR